VCAASSLFFFFQAEDGIRDFHVTGVQTCALPICATSWSCAADQSIRGTKATGSWLCRSSSPARRRTVHRRCEYGEPIGITSRPRSEERRVGKEGRSRGTREYGRKKSKKKRQERY